MLNFNYKQKGFCLLFTLLFIVILSSAAQSVGISIQSSGIVHDFEPGLEFTVDMAVLYPTMDSRIDIRNNDSYLMQFATLSKRKISLDDPDKAFSLHFKIPYTAVQEDFPPGSNKLSVIVQDDYSNVERGSGGIIFSAAASAYITILVPYPGFYLEIPEFSVSDVNQGKNSKLLFTAWNRGTNDLINTHYDFNIRDKDDSVLLEKSGTAIDILSEKRNDLDVPLSTYTFNPGYYNATLNYYYLDKVISKETTFKVGQLNIEIINTTKILFNDSIQQFDVKVRSDWNDVIKGVYGVVNFNGIESKTSPVDLSNFQTKTLTTFIDPSGIPSGNYTLDIDLFYSDEIKEKSTNIELLERPPGNRKSESSFNPIVIGLVTLIALLLIIIALFIVSYLKMQKNQGNKNGKK